MRAGRTAIEYVPLDSADGVVEAARAMLRRTYRVERHVVGAAIRCRSGQISICVNVSGSDVCAEIVALGTAISAGEREFARVAAVEGWTEERTLVPPCGRCRQDFADYTPELQVLILLDGQPVKVQSADLLPRPYHTFDDRYTG